MRGRGERCLQGFDWEGKSKRPLGRLRHVLEDNIKLGLREIGIDGENWIQLAQNGVHQQAFVNMVMNLQVP
jgi:hypothetical protein